MISEILKFLLMLNITVIHVDIKISNTIRSYIQIEPICRIDLAFKNMMCNYANWYGKPENTILGSHCTQYFVYSIYNLFMIFIFYIFVL